nr:hypothetical protein [Candidatus Njordarchaeum guaymaensis]
MSAKEGRKGSGVGKLRFAFLLALVAGTLMILAGVTGSVGILGFAFAELEAHFPQYATAIGYVLIALTVIASLGGVAVIIGGFLVLGGRVTTGKLFIGLGAGFGLITVVIGLVSGLAQGYGLYASFIAVFATGQTLGWVGLFLSILARMFARK